MTSVIPGIYWLKLPLSLAIIAVNHVNVYLIRGDNGYLLVDAGWNTNESFYSLRKQMSEIGADIKDITRILVTHIHPDHYGQAGRIKQLSGAEIITHDIEKEFIEPRYINMDKLLEQISHWLTINGVPANELADIRDATIGGEQYAIPTNPDTTLHGGEIISTGEFTFQVLWTPGHSAGHICLYEPKKKILVSGDHILPTITSNVSLHPQSGENPLGRYLNSLNTLQKMDIRFVLPGHESPFTKIKTKIDKIIQHYKERSQEILMALKVGPKTAYQIAREVTWSNSSSWQNTPFFHKRLAIFETLAHLELLTIYGQVGSISKDSIIYHRQT